MERRTLSAKVVERSLDVPLMATEGTEFDGMFVLGAEKGLAEKGLVLPATGAENGFAFFELAAEGVTPNMLLPRVGGSAVVEGFA